MIEIEQRTNEEREEYIIVKHTNWCSREKLLDYARSNGFLGERVGFCVPFRVYKEMRDLAEEIESKLRQVRR